MKDRADIPSYEHLFGQLKGSKHEPEMSQNVFKPICNSRDMFFIKSANLGFKTKSSSPPKQNNKGNELFQHQSDFSILASSRNSKPNNSDSGMDSDSSEIVNILSEKKHKHFYDSDPFKSNAYWAPMT